jgi:hypothetical protein
MRKAEGGKDNAGLKCSISSCQKPLVHSKCAGVRQEQLDNLKARFSPVVQKQETLKNRSLAACVDVETEEDDQSRKDYGIEKD